MSSTPMQAGGYSWRVYEDPAATMSGGTPLVVSRAGRADYVAVKLHLLLTYERVIFELQQQLTHYKNLVDVLSPRPVQPEELRLESTPLNAASVRVLNSIVSARIPATALRGLDEED